MKSWQHCVSNLYIISVQGKYPFGSVQLSRMLSGKWIVGKVKWSKLKEKEIYFTVYDPLTKSFAGKLEFQARYILQECVSE